MLHIFVPNMAVLCSKRFTQFYEFYAADLNDDDVLIKATRPPASSHRPIAPYLWQQRPMARYVMEAAAHGSLCYGSSGPWLIMLWQQRPMAHYVMAAAAYGSLWQQMSDLTMACCQHFSYYKPTFQLLRVNMSVPLMCCRH